jgi:aminodeoxyfutalosine synthase
MSFAAIARKVRSGERLSESDGVELFCEPDLLALGALANEVRERLHGDRAYFNKNMRVEVTNVCVASCLFCSFAKLEDGAPGSHTMKLEEAWAELEARMDDPPREIHVVNGLHPGLPFSYYEELLRGFKRIKPDVHLKCFTAVEIHFFARHYGMTYEEVLTKLRAAGLDSLPGGGAEIFHPDVRARISGDKATADEYLEVHRVAHRMGMRTNATMLYGHVETFEHRVDHLLRLRALQDEVRHGAPAPRGAGLQAFVPLAFHPDGNGMKNLPAPTAVDDLRTIAVSRLLLDNVEHIKAYWVSSGPDVAQIALRFGADDVDGTIVHETIYHAAGARVPQGLREADLVRLIREAGRVPVERDTLYNVVREYPRVALPEAAVKVRDRKAGMHLETREPSEERRLKVLS